MLSKAMVLVIAVLIIHHEPHMLGSHMLCVQNRQFPQSLPSLERLGVLLRRRPLLLVRVWDALLLLLFLLHAQAFIIPPIGGSQGGTDDRGSESRITQATSPYNPHLLIRVILVRLLALFLFPLLLLLFVRLHTTLGMADQLQPAAAAIASGADLFRVPRHFLGEGRFQLLKFWLCVWPFAGLRGSPLLLVTTSITAEDQVPGKQGRSGACLREVHTRALLLCLWHRVCGCGHPWPRCRGPLACSKASAVA